MKNQQGDQTGDNHRAMCSAYELTPNAIRELNQAVAESERRFLSVAGEGHPAEALLPGAAQLPSWLSDLGAVFEVSFGALGAGSLADFLGIETAISALLSHWGTVSCSCCGSLASDKRVENVLTLIEQSRTSGTLLVALPHTQISFDGEEPPITEVAEWFGAERVILDGRVERVNSITGAPKNFEVVVGSFEFPLERESRRSCEREIRSLLGRGVQAVALYIVKDKKGRNAEFYDIVRPGFWCEKCAREIQIGGGATETNSLRLKLSDCSWSADELQTLSITEISEIVSRLSSSSAEYAEHARKLILQACFLLIKGGVGFLTLSAKGDLISDSEAYIVKLARISLSGLSDCTLVLDDVGTEYINDDLKKVFGLINELGARGVRTIVPLRKNLGSDLNSQK